MNRPNTNLTTVGTSPRGGLSQFYFVVRYPDSRISALGAQEDTDTTALCPTIRFPNVPWNTLLVEPGVDLLKAEKLEKYEKKGSM